MPKCHYVVNRIILTWLPLVVMFTCCFNLCHCLLNVWCVVYNSLMNNALHVINKYMYGTDSLVHQCSKLHHVELWKNARPI